MENVKNSGHILNEDHRPSLFQNSCTGNTSEEEKTVYGLLLGLSTLTKDLLYFARICNVCVAQTTCFII